MLDRRRRARPVTRASIPRTRRPIRTTRRGTNIHPTTGNQYIQIGKIFGAHLSPHDPRYQVFDTWAPGTVDTTAIE